MGDYLVWGLALLAASALLVVVEVFVPSAGVVAILAGVTAVAGVVVMFVDGWRTGVIGILIVVVLGPAVVGFALRIWPSTPMGRKVLSADATEAARAEREMLESKARMSRLSLVGREGVALTDLRPVGMVEIGGERHEALAEAGLIESGSRVRVTRVEDANLKVRRVG